MNKAVSDSAVRRPSLTVGRTRVRFDGRLWEPWLRRPSPPPAAEPTQRCRVRPRRTPHETPPRRRFGDSAAATPERSWPPSPGLMRAGPSLKSRTCCTKPSNLAVSDSAPTPGATSRPTSTPDAQFPCSPSRHASSPRPVRDTLGRRRLASLRESAEPEVKCHGARSSRVLHPALPREGSLGPAPGWRSRIATGKGCRLKHRFCAASVSALVGGWAARGLACAPSATMTSVTHPSTCAPASGASIWQVATITGPVTSRGTPS